MYLVKISKTEWQVHSAILWTFCYIICKFWNWFFSLFHCEIFHTSIWITCSCFNHLNSFTNIIIAIAVMSICLVLKYTFFLVIKREKRLSAYSQDSVIHGILPLASHLGSKGSTFRTDRGPLFPFLSFGFLSSIPSGPRRDSSLILCSILVPT